MDADLQREIILEHSQSRRHWGQPETFDLDAGHRDAESGDEVRIWLSLDEDRVREIRWEATGSHLLKASCSLMSEKLAGHSIQQAIETAHHCIDMLKGETESIDEERLGEVGALAGIRHLPARVRCASLPWRTFASTLGSRA